MAKVQLTARDRKLLRFLWYWRILTTNAIKLKYFKEATVKSTYKRLIMLKDAKYITNVYLGFDSSFGWALADKGYRTIIEDLPELENKGFKSETVQHDFILSATQLGCWISHLPPGCDTVTEQELKRVDSAALPCWAPVSDYYRPDGYWLVQQGSTQIVIALENEINIKAYSRYNRVTDFYNNRPEIKYVAWIVKTKSIAENLMDTLNKSRTREENPHQFLLLKDIMKKAWDAKIKVGTLEGFSLKQILMPQGVDKPWISPDFDHDRLLFKTKLS